DVEDIEHPPLVRLVEDHGGTGEADPQMRERAPQPGLASMHGYHRSASHGCGCPKRVPRAGSGGLRPGAAFTLFAPVLSGKGRCVEGGSLGNGRGRGLRHGGGGARSGDVVPAASSPVAGRAVARASKAPYRPTRASNSRTAAASRAERSGNAGSLPTSLV